MWALKAVHPNGETVTSSAGIPDHTNVPVVTPEMRVNYTIVGTLETQGNSDVDIVVLPYSHLAFMWRRRPTGSPEPDIDKDWNYVFFPVAGEYGSEFSAQCVPLDGTADPESEVVQFDYATSKLPIQYGRTRSMYTGITAHLDAPTLADQGRLVAGQLALEQTPTTFSEVVGRKGTKSYKILDPIQISSIEGRLPMTESALFQATPGAVVWEAREGVYMPMRFRDPVHLFGNDLRETLAAVSYDTGTYLLQDTRKFGIVPGSLLNELTGVILFRGIDNRANINVKVRRGLESLVDSATAIAPFQHQSPVLDPLAIDRVTQIAQSSPMAYPACYNDWGEILNVIKQVVGVVKPVAKFVGGLGIPIVSDLGNGIGDFAGKLGLGPRNRRMQRALMRAATRY